jgi:hypothetical protein
VRSIPSTLRRKGNVEVTQGVLYASTEDGIDLSQPVAGRTWYPFDLRLSGSESHSCCGSLEKQNPKNQIPPFKFLTLLAELSSSVKYYYTVSQEERSIFWEVIVSVILRKKFM